jgi:C4-dicarboxylate-specific signal transduction histidine kinase
MNLVMNAGEAMNAMPDGARVLDIRSKLGQPNEVIIAVKDSKDVDRIFDPFFTTKSQGKGMGLSICRSIIEAGQLSASPGITRGAVFQIALPSKITDCFEPSSDCRP